MITIQTSIDYEITANKWCDGTLIRPTLQNYLRIYAPTTKILRDNHKTKR